METLQTMVQLMLLSNYLHERAQEAKGEPVPPARRSEVARLGRQMMGRVLMALGERLSGVGKHLLEEVC